jgi:hypothetical protein
MLAIVLFMLFGGVSLAQEPLVSRSTKSYLIFDGNPDDTAFLKEKCRQAGLDLGLSVLANRIPTDSKFVMSKPSEHLLRQGTLHLQLPIDDSQTEFAVYHSTLFDQPASINVLQIDEELITYRTTEKSGNIHLFYNCVRGAFGTKRSAHAKNATVYKLWDTPERTLLPDLELQDQMAQAEAKKLAKTDYPLLIFNDLKSYAYNVQGDLAIGRLLDTMHKYNPDKLLQADLLTPMSWQYLSRVNENLNWNASMRIKIVETLSEKQDFYRKTKMPWMIGNFQIHLADKNRNATTLEELEWFLSKAAAFDAGFGLDCSVETLRKHGMADILLNSINNWETLRLANAFNEVQKERFKDPYENWHIEKKNDSTYWLFQQQISRRYTCESNISHCDTCKYWGNMHGNWNWKSPYNCPLSFIVKVEGKGSISDLCVITSFGELTFPCTVKSGQYLIYDGHARITDLNFNTIEEFYPQGAVISASSLLEGENMIGITCPFMGEGKRIPEVTVRYITRDAAEIIIP